jgi:asparagine synthetase B (glutamine-hydrolysing)
MNRLLSLASKKNFSYLSKLNLNLFKSSKYSESTLNYKCNHFNTSISYRTLPNINEEKEIKKESNEFGVGENRFSRLDSKVGKTNMSTKERNKIENSNRMKRLRDLSKKIVWSVNDDEKKVKSYEKKFKKRDCDSFGTLSNDLNTVHFNANISRSKPLMESRFLKDEESIDEINENEKEYDKVLRHRRLTNDPQSQNTENFYANKIKKLGKEGKVNFIHIISNIHFISILFVQR